MTMCWKTKVYVSLLVAGLFAPLTAQPTDGDLILTIATGPGNGQPPSGGFTAYFRPGGKGALTTIAVDPPSSFPNYVRMGPNNRGLVISRIAVVSTSPTTISRSPLVIMDTAGRVTTLTPGPGLNDSIDGFELDHDNQWVAVLNDFGSGTYLIGVDHSTGSVTTFAARPANGSGFNELAIDRDPGAAVYAGAWFTPSTQQSPKIFGVDRQGNLTTIASTSGDSLRGLNAIELHPRSGDYLVVDPSLTPGEPVASRVTKGGGVTSINIPTLSVGNAARIGQDDLAWIVDGRPGQTSTPIAQYDFSTNTVVTIHTVNHPTGFCTGVEIYGSRPLTCNGSGKPGTSVSVSLRSHRPAAGYARYALAASLARRPGLKMPNGEWLDLAPDGLFLITALNLAPTVFQNFQGALDAFGTGSARVDIPANLPAKLGVTVFVAGIIYNQRGIVQVTPSHWIVLS